MAVEIGFKLTVNPGENLHAHAALLRRVAAALEQGKSVTERIAEAGGVPVPPDVALAAGEAAHAKKQETTKPAPKAAAPVAAAITETAPATPPKRGPGRPPKVKAATPPPPPPPAEDDEDTEVELGEPFEPRRNNVPAETDDLADMGLDLDDEPAAAPKLDYEKDLLASIRAYGKKFAEGERRAKVETLFRDLGVQHAREIPEAKWAEVIKRCSK